MPNQYANSLLRPWILICMALCCPVLWAGTVTIEPVADNSIFQEADESNGKGVYLFSGKTSTINGGALRRALLKFDPAAAIPAGAVVESASLELNMNKAFTPAGQAMTLHPLLAPWGEGASDAIGQEGTGVAAQAGDATWRHTFYPSQLWAAPGGDYFGVPSAVTQVAGLGKYTWTGPAMAADVQGWLNNPGSNFGWILVGLETTTSAKRFDSREAANAANRPKLTVTYSLPLPSWAGYPVSPDGRSVDTEGFLGWIDIEAAPWIYSYSLGKYVYLPEEYVGEGGGWTWVPR